MMDQGQKSQQAEKLPNQHPKGKTKGNDLRQQRRGHLMDGEKRKDPEANPVLKYGPTNNFMKFKEALLKSLFGNIGKLIIKVL
jgi:hypothetical protein